jgi:integrase
VPTRLIPLVTKLAARTDSDGYLIRASDKNKYGLRGNAIGQRFGVLKRRLGYGPRHTFHSIRHSFATMLSRGGVPMEGIRDLLGHEDGNVTEGYIDESELLARLEWIDKSIRFE